MWPCELTREHPNPAALLLIPRPLVRIQPDKTGTDESSRRAAEWVKEDIGATANPPAITEGGTVVHFSS
jgi:hypothetical protein